MAVEWRRSGDVVTLGLVDGEQLAYIICYLAMGLPAILAGVLVIHSTVTRTAQEFAITVIALAAITALGTILIARRSTRQRCLSPSPAK